MKKLAFALIAAACSVASYADTWGYTPYGYSIGIGDTTYHRFNDGSTGYSSNLGGGMMYHQFQQPTYQPQQPRFQGYQQYQQPYTWPAPAQIQGIGR